MMRASKLILTPEHVEVRLQPAGMGRRFLAFSIDLFVSIALMVFLASVLGKVLPRTLAMPLTITGSFVIGWGYHVYFESRHEGRSPGKRSLGLRVVDGRGLPLGLGQCFVRSVVRVLDSAPLLYGLGALVALLDRHGRRLGDLAADTVVVSEGRTEEPDATALLAPGTRTAEAALRESFPSVWRMMLGAALVLVLAGLIEGSFSQFSARIFPYPLKIGVAATLFLGLVSWLFVRRLPDEAPQ